MEVVNRAHIEEATMGDEEFAVELASVFVDDTRKQVANLQEALRAHDLGQIASLAHRVKGASGNMGAERLCSICGEIERAAKNEEGFDCDQWVERTGEEFGRVTEELSRILPGINV